MRKGTKRLFFIVILLVASLPCKAETVADIDARADRYYSEKKFSDAIREWLSALDLDPSNEKIQRKIEMLYEEKHRKNLAVQRAKIIMRETIDKKDTATLDVIENDTRDAVDNFVVAYRIDPNDPEIKALRPKMEKFQNEMLVELEKKRRSESDKRKYREAIMLAQQLMSQDKYEDALVQWNIALDVFSDDPSAKEGKRKAELAISNRLKYEKIKSLLARGIELYNLKNYNDSLVELKQVLLIDPANDEADTYIGKIEDVIDSQRSAERKRQQAEQFNEARDNFENALSLIPNYKDANARINSIKKLRDDYNERLKKQKLADIEKEFENGLVNFAEGRYKEALSSFERTVLLDPKNTLAQGYLDKTKDVLREKQEEDDIPLPGGHRAARERENPIGCRLFGGVLQCVGARCQRRNEITVKPPV